MEPAVLTVFAPAKTFIIYYFAGVGAAVGFRLPPFSGILVGDIPQASSHDDYQVGILTGPWL